MSKTDTSLPQGPVNEALLNAFAGRSGAHHRLEGAGADGERVLIDGRMLSWRSPTGVLVHASEGRELEDFTSIIEVPPRLALIVLLEGELTFALGDRHFRLGPVASPATAQCVGLLTTRPEVLTRPMCRGRHLRKVTVTVEWGWLARRMDDLNVDAGVASWVLERQTASAVWHAQAHTADLAEAVLAPPSHDGLMRRLHMESRALELIAAALAGLERAGTPVEAGPAGGGRLDLRRVNAALDYIESRMAEGPSLAETARHAGLSARSLQRHFKRAFGESLFHYLRRRRLERAREALARGELTVGEAAFFAGYRHVSNFVTAYRRKFGCTPGSETAAGG